MNKVFDFETEFVPKGFLQMIYVDENGLDPANYNFDYVRQEFLGEVRTLVFDVTPKKGKKGPLPGPHLGRGQDIHHRQIQRHLLRHQRHDARIPFRQLAREHRPKSLAARGHLQRGNPDQRCSPTKAEQYKAQTRLWGYDAARSNQQEEELSRVLVESSSPVKDQSQTNNDLSPIQEATRVESRGRR